MSFEPETRFPESMASFYSQRGKYVRTTMYPDVSLMIVPNYNPLLPQNTHEVWVYNVDYGFIATVDYVEMPSGKKFYRVFFDDLPTLVVKEYPRILEKVEAHVRQYNSDILEWY